ncbi:MAG TPA: glycerol-3-phosphate acyltransferase [Candidatus Dormibacteraeota bacterium]|nr:glycerol-3-phosphate acyltransferase [Candidatus Dormibacteraeota bacterium]
MTMTAIGLWFLAGYVTGSVPVGLLVGRLRGIDIRRYGTGNIGASNVWRNLGLLPAALVGPLTFAQGVGPAWAAGWLTGSPWNVAGAAVGSVAGYGWSFLLHFHGGSAVGTATGALAALSPPGLVPLLGLYALGGLLRQPAPGVLLGLIAFVVYMAVSRRPAELLAASALIVALVVLKRLDGILDDLRGGDRRGEILVGRLIFDRRPGQRLVGPND